ncbi:MAG TPA: sigma-70 region 4 domain-containing protein [Solirubrobacterales bacterium]|nr:sigma-70 region 4 domain-containing protein [Solirubrobacterales bacterium]
MAESLETSMDVTLIRRELERLRNDVQKVGEHVKEVDAKVDRSNAAQLGAMAAALAADGDVPREVVLKSAGMSTADIAVALGKSENAIRVALSRARRRGQLGSKKQGG